MSYTGNMNLSMPDLSSYNLMNARRSWSSNGWRGGTSRPVGGPRRTRMVLNKLYNEKLKVIESGVDTYWLAEPLRVGVNQKHSLYVQGGEGISCSVWVPDITGFRGDGKVRQDVISGNIDLIYRMPKFQFSNKFSLTSTHLKEPDRGF